MKKNIFIFCLLLIIIGMILLQQKNKSILGKVKEGTMKLTSDFEYNEKIPSKYTCDGEDLAPVLKISEIPQNTKSLALIVDDPDAPMGTWVHWVVYNIPENTTKIDSKNFPTGTKQGMTDFGRIGWGGPCPPNGTHRYFFKLYALDEKTNLAGGLTKAQLETSIREHVIEKAELVGLYQRQK